MAFNDAMPQPNAPTTAPAPAVDAPDIQTPAPSTDPFAGLSQPGSAPSAMGSQEGQGLQTAQAATVKSGQDLAAAAAAPIATVPQAHARLFSIINAIGIGLSAAGKSIGSGGKEGGAAEVAQIEGEQQRQKLEAQQAAQAAKNADVQNKLTAFNTNTALTQSWMNLMSMPDEMTQKHAAAQTAQLDVTSKQQTNIGQQQDLATKALSDLELTGNKAQYDSTLQQLGIPQTAGTTPGASSPLPPVVLARWQNAATQGIGSYPNDPQMKQLAATIQAGLADPSKVDPTVLATAANQIRQRQAALDAIQTSRKGQAETTTAEATAKYAVPKSQADIALANARAAASTNSATKSAFDLGQAQREDRDLATPDATGFSSQLGPKEYDKRYDAFTKSKDYQTLSTLKGSYQQFNDTLNHIATTGEMTGAESVVGLFNAIGISATPLAGKGFRINSNTVEEHQEARGIDQAAYQRLLALKNGDVITPQQLKDYSNIAAGVYHNSYVNAADEAHRQGLPVDFLPQGGGRALDATTARIYTDVILHTNPSLAKNPQALKDAIKKSVTLNGWSVQ